MNRVLHSLYLYPTIIGHKSTVRYIYIRLYTVPLDFWCDFLWVPSSWASAPDISTLWLQNKNQHAVQELTACKRHTRHFTVSYIPYGFPHEIGHREALLYISAHDITSYECLFLSTILSAPDITYINIDQKPMRCKIPWLLISVLIK